MYTHDLIESPALKTAKVRRANARTRLGKAQIAAERARRLHETATAAVADLEAAVSESHVVQGQRLAAQIAAGGPSDASPPVDDQMPALSAARVHAAIAAEALKALTAEHELAAAELEAADEAVADEAERILDDCADEIAARVIRACDDLMTLGEQLREFAPDGLRTPINVPLPARSPQVQRALDRIPPLDVFNTPINEISRLSSGATWARRRAALMQDDAVGDTEASEAA